MPTVKPVNMTNAAALAYDILIQIGLGQLHPQASSLAKLVYPCSGRGCAPHGIGAAIALYLARREGIEYSIVYKIIRNDVPKQTLYNGIGVLLRRLGHSSMFKHVLRGRAGAWVQRRPNEWYIEAEYYGRRPRARSSVEYWPGPPIGPFVWRRGIMGARITVEYDIYRLHHALRRMHGDEWFTSRDIAEILYITVDSAARLLSLMEDAGLVESRRKRNGVNMKEYRALPI